MSREFAKGAPPKRIFKPTIPTTRRSTQRAASTGVTGGCGDGIWETCDQNNSCNSKVKGKQNNNKPRGKKEFIQLDATFNGINKIPSAVKAEKAFISPEVSGFGHSNDTRSSQSDSPRGSTGQINGLSVKVKSGDEPSYDGSFKTTGHHFKEVIKPGEETEEDVASIQRVLYRDDFVSLYDPNEEDMTPIGWNCVSQHQVFKEENKPKDRKSTSIKFDKWACTKKEQDKMVLFQLPEMLLNSADGHVGKIRMYQSGKMELIDTRTGVVHDLLHTDCQVNPHPPCDDDDDNNDSDNNSDTDNNSEENDAEFKESATTTTAAANGESPFSTDWIKKEVEDDKLNNRNYDSPPSTTFSKPSTSSSYLSSSVQYPSSSSKLNPSLSLSSSKSSRKSSKSSSKNPKVNSKLNRRRNNCDKNEENDDDDDTDEEDDRNINQSYREACTFDGEKVICLGPISNNELLIGRPRLDKFINL